MENGYGLWFHMSELASILDVPDSQTKNFRKGHSGDTTLMALSNETPNNHGFGDVFANLYIRDLNRDANIKIYRFEYTVNIRRYKYEYTCSIDISIQLEVRIDINMNMNANISVNTHVDR